MKDKQIDYYFKFYEDGTFLMTESYYYEFHYLDSARLVDTHRVYCIRCHVDYSEDKIDRIYLYIYKLIKSKDHTSTYDEKKIVEFKSKNIHKIGDYLLESKSENKDIQKIKLYLYHYIFLDYYDN